MKLIVNLLVSGLAVFITAYVLPGVRVADFMTAVIVAVVLGAVNVFLKPILVILTLPITVLTLGLFLFVINAAVVWLVGSVVPGFTVANFWWALAFSLVLSLVSSFLHLIAK